MPAFRQLESEDVREYWSDEAHDFTPWIADDIQSAESSFVEDVLGLDLELVSTERSVGRYQLDVLAKVNADGRKVVIENQLTASDHDHLGKVIAYAAGIKADIIVWIGPQFHDEHIDAVQWLNKNSHEGIDIFAVELEVVTIGDSEPAVRLSPVAEPSEWTDRIQRSERDLTGTEQTYEQFWTELRDRIEQESTPLRPRRPYHRGYYENPFGHTDVQLGFAATKQSDNIACRLTIDNVELYETLATNRAEIDAALDTDLEWEPPASGSKLNRGTITATREGDIFVEDKRGQRWQAYHDWFLEIGAQFHDVFGEYIRNLSGNHD